MERYATVLAGERVPKQFEINLLSRDGHRVPTEVTSARTVWRKESAELIIMRDISERKQAEEDIQQLAYYDTLTGLPNRTLLHDRLRQMIAHAGRDGHTMGVMFLDLDRFKSINDSLGHLTGDLLLKGVGARLAATVREADTVARLGGDEFVVVVSAIAHEEHLAKVADKIIALFDEPIVVDGQEIFTTCSIGIATFPNDGADASNLLKNADIAMYQAKEQGRNNYQFFSPEMNVKALEQMMLETSLRRALERQEFFLAYQPQVELPSGRVIGTEALLRWQHPELGVVAPMRFIPLAEETGLIIPIGEWVLRTACAGNKKWLDRGARLRVAVNLSARQLNQPGFVALVADILRETGLPPEALELEVTESMIMTKNSSTMTVLTKLKEMGVGLAIDDFGTGYSSLSYLKHFPIDRIKIDRSFVRDIPANPDDTAISEAIIAMAHSLNLKVTAEGVEHQEQLHFLASRFCDEIQGFFFMPPVSAEAVEEVIFGGAPLRHAKSM